MGYYNEIGIHVAKNINEARRWYQIAAEQGNKDAVGRLESLDQDRSLSKQDHETTTLTRIKSQHGSMRGKRPDRFKQPQQMPAVAEGSGPVTPVDDRAPRISPLPSPGMRPTIVTEHNLPDPSRAAFVSGEAAQSTQSLPLRPHSSAPYPDGDDNRPPPLNMAPLRARSAAPYPEDDMRGPVSPPLAQGGRPPHGPAADRPGSAFGIRTQGGPGPGPGAGPGPGPRPIAGSQSMGNLHPNPHPDPRGRVASTGYGPPNPGGFRQPGQGPPNPAMNQYPRDDMHGRAASAQPYPNNHQQPGRGPRPPMGPPQHMNSQPLPGSIPPAGMDPGRNFDPRMGSARPVSEIPKQQNQERFSRVPGAAGTRVDRVSLNFCPIDAGFVAHSPQVPTGHGAPPPQAAPNVNRPHTNSPGPAVGRVGTAPPAQMQRPPEKRPSPAPTAASAPAKPAKQGPATFEDMGIPQGKQDGDCVSREFLRMT
jgi:hypothetical protein